VRDSRGLLILLAVVVIVATVVWFLTRPPSPRGVPESDADQPIRFLHDDVPVVSPDLAVELERVVGAIHTSYSSWSVVLVCREPDGCSGDLELEVAYRSGPADRKLVMITHAAAPAGGELRFEGLQDPPEPIDGVDGLTLAVRRPAPVGVPLPDVID
jgi:hypothetical protein